MLKIIKVIFSCVILFYAFFGILFWIYCRVMPFYEQLKNNNTSKMNEDQSINNTSERKKVFTSLLIRIIIVLLENYMYGLMRYSVICVGRIPSNRVRNLIYRFVFNAKISRKTVINGGCEIRSPWNFVAGNCIIMNNCILDARNSIVINDNVVFGQGVHIWTEEHDVDSSTFAVTDKNRGPVIIHERAWICSDSTILPNVEVGEGAVLASRAVATRDLQSFGIYVGVPAELMRERNHELYYELSGKPHWHFY